MLLRSNRLLFTADLVKKMLIDAYKCDCEIRMAEKITAIIDTCNATDNSHFRWFAKLLDSHFEGIIAHASLPISSGKMEGINNKIKTLRPLFSGWRCGFSFGAHFAMGPLHSAVFKDFFIFGPSWVLALLRACRFRSAARS